MSRKRNASINLNFRSKMHPADKSDDRDKQVHMNQPANAHLRRPP
jgi:hypothetical protein